MVHNQGWYEFEGKLANGRPLNGNLIVFSNPETREVKFTAEILDDPESKAKISYFDKKYYEGQIDPKSFLPEGAGRMEYPNGNSYEGNWKGGQFHGSGRFSWHDGSSYNGDYVEGTKHGQGRFVYPSKKYYEGSWENGSMHGQGKMCDQNDNVVNEGNWNQGNYAAA